MSASTGRPYVKFHIGAPRIAADVVKDAAKLMLAQQHAGFRLIKTTEFQKFLRPIVNASVDVADISLGDAMDGTDFWRAVDGHKLLVGSQHALMGHPKIVFKNGTILPNAEFRVGRLTSIFGQYKMELHLTIANPVDYLGILPTSYLKGDVTSAHDETVPSWYNFVSRIRETCPRNPLVVWDFSEPEKLALPFAVTMLDLDEETAQSLKQPLGRSLQHSTLMTKVFEHPVSDADVREVLLEQFEEDMQHIERLDKTVLIRASSVPDDFFLEAARRT